MNAPRREKRDVHGWIILDKPVGMTSTQAVGFIKRLTKARRCGHAGTLDPLASGCLPIALGEATKTVPFVMDGRKVYRFTVCFGEQRDTDDREGKVIATSDHRPADAAIAGVLPRFVGEIMQVPPKYSAIKVDGERAYDLARDGEQVELQARPIVIHRLDLVARPDADHVVLEAECGKGTYVRAIARDMGQMLGTVAYVSDLRRTLVGPFDEEDFLTPAELEEMLAGDNPGEALLPVETALDDLPLLTVSRNDAARLANGQGVILRGRDAPILSGPVAVQAAGALVAIGEVEQGELRPKRVFQFGG